MTDLETLRALILGDGETRIDSYEAAERVKRWLDANGWDCSLALPQVTYSDIAERVTEAKLAIAEQPPAVRKGLQDYFHAEPRS